VIRVMRFLVGKRVCGGGMFSLKPLFHYDMESSLGLRRRTYQMTRRIKSPTRFEWEDD